jgi:DNA-binding transcriptional MerR regulator
MTLSARTQALTIGQLSAVLGISARRIRRLERTGALPRAERGFVSGERYYLTTSVPVLRRIVDSVSRRSSAA